MRKQELVHLHALCVELQSHVEDHHDLSSDAFHSYEEFDVSPNSIHRRKQFHREAVFRLLAGFASVIDDQSASPDHFSSPSSE